MRYILLILVVIFLSGCFSDPEKKHYYQIYYQNRPFDKKIIDKVVRVKKFKVDKAYNRYNIIYRTSPYQLFYYKTHLWAVKPDYMMTDIMGSDLKKANIFKEVITKLEKIPNYVVTGRIISLDEIDSKDKWFAHVSMTFTFSDFETNKLIVSHTFDQKKEVFNKKPVYVIRAMSEIVEKEMKIFIKKIYEHFNP